MVSCWRPTGWVCLNPLQSPAKAGRLRSSLRWGLGPGSVSYKLTTSSAPVNRLFKKLAGNFRGTTQVTVCFPSSRCTTWVEGMNLTRSQGLYVRCPSPLK